MDRLSRRTSASVLLLAVAFVCSGCVWGNSPKVQQPTMGQEMIDLKRAVDDGAISTKEYDRAKSDLLNSMNR